MRIGCIGLGAMGRPMGGRLAAAGHAVTGFDRDPGRRAEGVAPAGGLAEAIAGREALLLSLPDSPAVEAVMEAVYEQGAPGLLVVDTSTADPLSTRAIQERAAARGIGFVDAPVSGGASGAAQGRLLAMIGGAEPDLDRTEALLAPLTRAVVRCGGPGAGNVAKLVNNLMCAAHLVLAGEALRLGEAAGIAPETLAAVLAAGSGRSAAIEVNLPQWVFSGTYDSGFTMGLMAKDVRLARALGEAVEALGPLAEAAAERVAEGEARFGAAADFNRLVDLGRGGA
ncbi:NAD(P)-dependent oxidoreductase [Salinarimonas ramus]|uniref:3-hydroxyisobutyrate dehydrogenase n=1 Tax=Salinarimonas ramus TaxID=690164 RepID=A0A917Q5M4_9HYPH|nr:NAD(P)-dependent oxidoreductase [Salinarimonas ramus]GGK26240.1 3-hydroxyisobutyrate dehydrogenase [Salinarimonas ramus]